MYSISFFDKAGYSIQTGTHDKNANCTICLDIDDTGVYGQNSNK
jgi:hypothetical protein